MLNTPRIVLFRRKISLKFPFCFMRIPWELFPINFAYNYMQVMNKRPWSWSSVMASVSYGLRFLPILWSLLLVTTVVSSRLMANAIHTKEFVHTNAFQCAQSILSQLLDLLALIGLLSIVVRYLHLEMLTKGCQEEIHTSIGRLRMASLTFGVGSMLGITVISNFRPPNDLVSKVCNHVYDTVNKSTHPERDNLFVLWKFFSC